VDVLRLRGRSLRGGRQPHPARPTKASPDPEAGTTAAQPVRVGRYRALFVHYRASFGRGLRGPVVLRELIRQLYVELPVGKGKFRDLLVGGARISKASLIKIGAHGLSRRQEAPPSSGSSRG